MTGSAAVVVARAVVRDEYDGAAAAGAFARLVLVMGAAPVLAPVAGAQVLRLTSWRGVFVLLAAFGAVLLVLSARRLPETLPPERRQPAGLRPTLRTYRRLLRDGSFLWPALAGGAAFAAMFAYIAGSPLLQEVHGLSAATSAWSSPTTPARSSYSANCRPASWSATPAQVGWYRSAAAAGGRGAAWCGAFELHELRPSGGVAKASA